MGKKGKFLPLDLSKSETHSDVQPTIRHAIMVKPTSKAPSLSSIESHGALQNRTIVTIPTRTTLSPWRPDVYAHNFIPRSLLAINNSPARSIALALDIGIDFNNYISTFAGSDFLRAVEEPSSHVFGAGVSPESLDRLGIQNYGQYFRDALMLDLQAQIPETRSYDLYGVTLEPLDNIKQVYTLRVPGLREGTPPVSLGDALMLRQLILDPLTRLPHGTEAWLTSGGSERGELAPGFTGAQVRAVVIGIDKSNELLVLNAMGVGPDLQLICNVMFEVPPRLANSLHRAVADVAQELLYVQYIDTGPLMQHSNGAKASVPESATDNPPSRTITKDVNTSRLKKNDWLLRMLFPVDAYGIQQEKLPSAVFPQKWVDKALNFEQQKAVNAVQSRVYGELCYLINGPPGTGKTKTLCEMVVQLGMDPAIRGSILVCAPSNPAADTLALRLRSHFRPGTLLRLNEYSRTFAEVPQELLPYCWVEHDMFYLPPLSKLMAYKIVVVTCQGADTLIQARVTNCDLVALQDNMARAMNPESDAADKPASLHWVALIIDEAAQATEPETLVPLAVVAPPPNHSCTSNPIFVMAGDQHQLNARTFSKDTTLQISLFERLSNALVYATHPLARKNLHRGQQQDPMIRPPFVNLTRNYRSHPAILALPSSLFYSNTLIPEATQVESLQAWTGWQGRRWPVLFACNGGLDDCEDIRGLGGGWLNVQEAHKAIAYARSLLSENLISDESEICIMSPFRAQVKLIRQYAKIAGLRRINIGPMEAFQGLESRFVIVCTTRARTRFLSDDELKGVGLVKQKKKFNVALTRAKEGLIVLGNPWVLAIDPCWLAFLRFCQRNGLWQNETLNYKPTRNSEERSVNDWRSIQVAETDHAVSGLEAALLYKERDKTAGSRAAKRFMSGAETQEDSMWRAGLEAEEEVEEEESDDAAN